MIKILINVSRLGDGEQKAMFMTAIDIRCPSRRDDCSLDEQLFNLFK